MNSTAALLLSCVSVGFGAVAAYFALERGPEPAVQAAGTQGRGGADLSGDLAALRQEITDLRTEVGLIRGGSRRAAAAVDEDAIARAVALYMEQQGGDPSATSAEPADGPEAALGSVAEIAELLAASDQVGATELWERLVAEGRDKELLDHLKAIADANPHDPEAQLALGNAYLGRTQQAAGPMAGFYATLADKALDRALEAAPDHWEARFTKAMALSFWPPNLGKQPEAIRQFETLVGQQAGATPRPEHAQTHFLLGNLYQQNGQPEKALEAWRAGLALFPGDAQLAAQVALMEGR